MAGPKTKLKRTPLGKKTSSDVPEVEALLRGEFKGKKTVVEPTPTFEERQAQRPVTEIPEQVQQEPIQEPVDEDPSFLSQAGTALKDFAVGEAHSLTTGAIESQPVTKLYRAYQVAKEELGEDDPTVIGFAKRLQEQQQSTLLDEINLGLTAIPGGVVGKTALKALKLKKTAAAEKAARQTALVPFKQPQTALVPQQGFTLPNAEIVGGKLFNKQTQKLANQAKATVDGFASKGAGISELHFTTDGLKAAKGVKITSETFSSTGKIPINTVTEKLGNTYLTNVVKSMGRPTVVGLTILGMLGTSLGSYPWAAHDIAEAMDPMALARDRAEQAGDEALVAEIDQAVEGFMDQTLWEKLPVLNVVLGAIEKQRANWLSYKAEKAKTEFEEIQGKQSLVQEISLEEAQSMTFEEYEALPFPQQQQVSQLLDTGESGSQESEAEREIRLQQEDREKKSKQ